MQPGTSSVSLVRCHIMWLGGRYILEWSSWLRIVRIFWSDLVVSSEENSLGLPASHASSSQSKYSKLGAGINCKHIYGSLTRVELLYCETPIDELFVLIVLEFAETRHLVKACRCFQDGWQCWIMHDIQSCGKDLQVAPRNRCQEL